MRAFSQGGMLHNVFTSYPFSIMAYIMILDIPVCNFKKKITYVFVYYTSFHC